MDIRDAFSRFFVGSSPEVERKEPVLNSVENPATPITSAELTSIMIGPPTDAGPPVTEASSIRSTTVFRCVSLVAGSVASMALQVYKDGPKGRETDKKNRFYSILHDRPHPDLPITSFIWRELMTVCLLLWGNFYALIEWNKGGGIIGFIPLMPNQVDVRRVNNRNRYRIQLMDGSVIDVDQEDMLHVPGIGFDGIKGLSVIRAVGRQTIGTSLGLEQSVARSIANGVRPSGAIETAPGLSKEGLANLKAEVADVYSGGFNSGKVLFLDAGSKFNPMTISAKDAELLDERKFSVVDICRIFGVPPMLVGETADMTAWGSGIEQVLIAFKVFTLDPLLNRIEGELNLKFFEDSDSYAEFDRDSLNAMDSKAKGEFFKSLFYVGAMSPNQIRDKMNVLRDDHPYADEAFVPVAMVPISKAGHDTRQPTAGDANAPAADPSEDGSKTEGSSK